MLETPLSSTPGLTRISIGGSSNSSIRRRSLIPQKPPASNKNEERNDDDAERSSLVASERALATSTPHTASPRRGRDTMASSPQKEHFQGCLKLYAENVSAKICTLLSLLIIISRLNYNLCAIMCISAYLFKLSLLIL